MGKCCDNHVNMNQGVVQQPDQQVDELYYKSNNVLGLSHEYLNDMSYSPKIGETDQTENKVTNNECDKKNKTKIDENLLMNIFMNYGIVCESKEVITKTLNTVGEKYSWAPGFSLQLGSKGRKAMLQLIRKAYKSNKKYKRIFQNKRPPSSISNLPFFKICMLWELSYDLGIFNFGLVIHQFFGKFRKQSGPRKVSGRSSSKSSKKSSVTRNSGCRTSPRNSRNSRRSKYDEDEYVTPVRTRSNNQTRYNNEVKSVSKSLENQSSVTGVRTRSSYKRLINENVEPDDKQDPQVVSNGSDKFQDDDQEKSTELNSEDYFLKIDDNYLNSVDGLCNQVTPPPFSVNSTPLSGENFLLSDNVSGDLGSSDYTGNNLLIPNYSQQDYFSCPDDQPLDPSTVLQSVDSPDSQSDTDVVRSNLPLLSDNEDSSSEMSHYSLSSEEMALFESSLSFSNSFSRLFDRRYLEDEIFSNDPNNRSLTVVPVLSFGTRERYRDMNGQLPRIELLSPRDLFDSFSISEADTENSGGNYSSTTILDPTDSYSVANTESTFAPDN